MLEMKGSGKNLNIDFPGWKSTKHGISFRAVTHEITSKFLKLAALYDEHIKPL